MLDNEDIQQPLQEEILPQAENIEAAKSVAPEAASPVPAIQPRPSDPLMVQVYNAFRELGQTDLAAKALTAEVGRENAFQERYIYGTHSDPANRQTNIGIFSWQKDRRTNLINYLSERGLYKNGQIVRGYEAVKAQAQFALDELNSKQYGAGRILNYINSDQADAEGAARVLGKDYIKWRIDDPVYSHHNQHRRTWFKRISSALNNRVGDSNVAVDNVEKNDPNFDRKNFQETYNSLTRLDRQPATMLDKLALNWETTENSIAILRRQKETEVANRMIVQIEKDTGIPFPSNEIVDHPIATHISDWVSGTSVVQDSSMEAAYNRYVEQVKTQKPDYKIAAGDYQAVRLEVGKEILKTEEARARAHEEDSFLTSLGYGLVAGMPASLQDPINLIATVATLPLGAAGVLRNALIQGGVNVGIEGIQIGADSLSGAREQYGLPEMTPEEIFMRAASAGGLGAFIGGGAAALAKSLKAMPKASLTKEESFARDVLVDELNTSYTMPMENTPVGQDLYMTGIAKATRDISEGLPPSVVTDDIPGVNMSWTERTGTTPDSFVSKIGDIELDRAPLREALSSWAEELDARPSISKQEYTARVNNLDEVKASAEKQRLFGDSVVDRMYKQLPRFEVDLVPTKASPASKFKEASMNVSETVAVPVETLSQRASPIIERALGNIDSPKTVKQALTSLDEVYAAPIKVLDDQITASRNVLTRTADEVNVRDTGIKQLNEELSKTNVPERMTHLKERIKKLEAEKKELSNRVNKQTKDISKVEKQKEKLNKDLAKRKEDLLKKQSKALNERDKKQAKALRDSRLQEVVDKISKELDELEVSQSDARFILEGEDGSFHNVSVKELKEQLTRESNAIQMIAECVLRNS